MRTASTTVTTTGANGSAAGTGTIGVGSPARLVGVALKYGTQPNTTDVTVTDSWGRTLVTVTNGNTDTLVQPIVTAVTGAGADPGAGQSLRFVAPIVHGTIAVAVAQGDGAKTVDVVLILED